MEKILFFDGVCVMCNKLVHFVITHDKSKEVKFASLQSETAQEIVPQFVGSNLSTVVFKKGNKIFTESDAIINLMISLRGIFGIFYVFKIIPKFIRDKVYRFIAENRYKWFGKTTQCQLLSAEEKTRVLD